MKALLRVLVALTLLAPSAQAGLFGPDKFKIVPADARFEDGGTTLTTSLNNRISRKSVVGGTHLDAKGVFVDPFVRKASGTVLELGFVVTNLAEYSTNYGTPNTLGTIMEIAFAPEGAAPVVLKVDGTAPKWSDAVSYNTISRSASSGITEVGYVTLTIEQYESVAKAVHLAVRIVGSEHSVTYEPGDISSSFLPNLREFLDKAVLK